MRKKVYIFKGLKNVHSNVHSELLYSSLFFPIMRNKNPRFSLKIRDLLNFSSSSSGATGIRTRDTRIFSPLLYQLSYGTIVCNTFRDCECKGRQKFLICKLFSKKIVFFTIFASVIFKTPI